jgi:hypothetical protein
VFQARGRATVKVQAVRSLRCPTWASPRLRHSQDWACSRHRFPVKRGVDTANDRVSNVSSRVSASRCGRLATDVQQELELIGRDLFDPAA